LETKIQHMKILVTGGLGLIGHNVVLKLRQQNHNTVIVDTRTNYGIIPQSEIDYLMQKRLHKLNHPLTYCTDITDAGAIDYVIHKEKPDVIVHCASFPRQKVVNSDPAAGSRVMSEGLINLLESACTASVKRFVYLSSSMVYGDFKDYVTEDAICRPQGQYGIMKLAGEWLVKDYANKTGMEYVILRPSAVYGPLDVEDRVIAKFMLAAMRDTTLQVNGASETLDFTFVDDAADGVVAAATQSNVGNDTYNITKSHSVSLLQAAEMIVSLVGKGTIQVGERDKDFPSRGALDISKARVKLGFDPKVDVSEGFEHYFNWLKTSEYWSSIQSQS
jgi:nucleoside-diphosphate-sugar epimerase